MTTYISKTVVGITCLAALLIMCMSWLLAVACDPSWSFGNDTISCLGKSSVASAKCLFNYGFCVLGGLMVSVTGALYLFTKKSRMLHTVYAVLIIFAGIGLMAVGLAPIDSNKDGHTYAAIITCTLSGIVYLLTLAEVWTEKKYLVAGIMTTGLFLFLLLLIQHITAQIEMVAIIFFLFMLLYYACEWLKKEPIVVSLYGKKVKI